MHEVCTIYLNENKTIVNNTTLYIFFSSICYTEENQLEIWKFACSHDFCSYIRIIHKLKKIFVITFESNCF